LVVQAAAGQALAEVRAAEADQALAEAANQADASACEPILKTTKKPDQSPAFFMD
jgi:hypothetical protein